MRCFITIALLLCSASLLADSLTVLDEHHSGEVEVSLLLAGDASATTLDLKPFRVWTRDARIEVRGKNGLRQIAPPADRYFSGAIRGEPGSRAVIRVGHDGSRFGLIASNGGTWLLTDDGTVATDQTVALHEIENAHDHDHDENEPFSCQTLDPPHDAPLMHAGQPLGEQHQQSPTDARQTWSGSSASYQARVAVETDYEYFVRLGSDADAASRYMADLFAFISGMYESEVDTALTLSYLSLWEDSDDPWNQTGTSCALSEFGYFWNTQRQDVDRSIAHFVSGKNMGGGIAWVGVVCSGGWNGSANCPGLPTTGPFGGAYGVSANIRGHFNPEAPASVWDMTVIAHEIGHNFNSPHTHCYGGIGGNSNPVDRCFSESRAGCHNGERQLPGPAGQGSGTIMSYCHLLGGGQSNIAPTLGLGHPYGTQPDRVANRMLAHVQQRAAQNPSCLAPSEAESGFSLSASNTEQSLCLANGEQPDTIALSTQAIGGFDGQISFQAEPGLPEGFSGTLSRSPITPGQSTDLNLSLDDSVGPGRYAFDIRANASGAESQSVALVIDVAEAISGPSALIAPADNASELSSRPLFSWQPVAGASNYRLQLADNPGFNTPLIDQQTGNTELRSDSTLDPDQRYYWRVRAQGQCGNASWSSTRQFTTADCTELFSQNFDTNADGWSTSAANGNNHWSLSTNRSLSPNRSAFTAAPGSVSDRRLTSPTIAIPSNAGSAVLEFASWMDIETPDGSTCFDGAVVEVSRNDGAFEPIANNLLTGRAYNGRISGDYENPLQGLDAWCGASDGFELIAADLSHYAGDSLRLRFRLGTDNTIGAEGWYIDDVAINACGQASEEPRRFPLTVQIQGSGRVTASGTNLDCSANCNIELEEGRRITLLAEPDAGYRFDSWSGSCSGAASSCEITLNQARSVSAQFEPIEPLPEEIFSDRFEG